MSSCIFYGDHYMYVANVRLSAIVDLALEVGGRSAATSEEIQMVKRLHNWLEYETFPGDEFNLAERFPTLAERKFWACCFREIGRGVFLRTLGGNQSVSFWQSALIGEVYFIALLLTRAVQEAEGPWSPECEDYREEEEYRAKLHAERESQ